MSAQTVPQGQSLSFFMEGVNNPGPSEIVEPASFTMQLTAPTLGYIVRRASDGMFFFQAYTGTSGGTAQIKTVSAHSQDGTAIADQVLFDVTVPAPPPPPQAQAFKTWQISVSTLPAPADPGNGGSFSGTV